MSDCHPLVTQLRFTRRSFLECVENVPAQDAQKRINEMNCVSWTVGHLANQEHRYWVQSAQNKTLFPDLNDLVGYGKPASTPDLKEMLSAWHQITAQADTYLDTLTSTMLESKFVDENRVYQESIGTMLLRNIYHYWYHTGELHAIRELLGHTDLPVYVGEMSQAIYRHEQQ